MSAQSKMFYQLTLLDIPSAISSQASADGPLRCDMQDGQTSAQCGPVRVPVSHSQALREVATSGCSASATYGQPGKRLSLNDGLRLSLANRLPKPQIGSIKSAMTWKQWTTPSGRRFCRLAVSVTTMRGLGYSLRATPTATANQSAPSMSKHPGCKGLEVTPHAWCLRMGFPILWLDLGMRLCQKSQQCSSEPI